MKVAFYKSQQRLFNRLVSWYLKSPYSHCEIILDETTGLCGSSSFMDGGVRVKVIHFDTEHWDILEVPSTVQQDTTVKEWFTSHVGQKYDVWGLLGFIYRRQSGEKTKWFCSEALAEVLGYSDSFRYDPAVLYSVLKERI